MPSFAALLRISAAAFAIASGTGAASAAQATAVFPFEIYDTSGEAPQPDRAERLAMATRVLSEVLEKTGRYAPVDLAPLSAEVAATAPRYQCGNCFLPVVEDSLQPLTELFIQWRHLLCQVEERTTASNIFAPNWRPPDNADQSVNGWPVAQQRAQPPVAGKVCDDLFDDRVSKGFLAFEVLEDECFIDSCSDGDFFRGSATKPLCCKEFGRFFDELCAPLWTLHSLWHPANHI